MAGDSCSGGGNYATTCKNKKVAKVGSFLIGYTTSWRMGQILHHALRTTNVPKRGDILDHLVNKFVPNLQRTLQKSWWLRNDSGVGSGGNFLVAYRDRLFEFQSDFSVLEDAHEFDSVGCGHGVAKGALFALQSSTMNPQKKLETALQAACEFSAFVRPPFVFVDNFPK